MSLTSVFQYIDKLTSSKDSVPEDVPCKVEILAMRQCLEAKGQDGCYDGVLDLMSCKADYRVEAEMKDREGMGIAKYMETVKELQDTLGKDGAAQKLGNAKEEQRAVKDYRLLWRTMNGMHPKSTLEQASSTWSYADQVRLEMGETAWKEQVAIVTSEFGSDNADKLFGIQAEATAVKTASQRLGVSSADQLEELKSKFSLGVSSTM